MRRALVSTLAVGLALAAGAAEAGSNATAKALKTFGLLGEWSRDCSADLSAGVSRTVYEALPDGRVKLTYRMGPGVETVYYVNSVETLSSSQVRMEEVSDQDRPFRVTLTREGDRIRVFQSIDPSSGRAFVADGVITGNGRPTTWESRCP